MSPKIVYSNDRLRLHRRKRAELLGGPLDHRGRTLAKGAQGINAKEPIKERTFFGAEITQMAIKFGYCWGEHGTTESLTKLDDVQPMFVIS